MGRLAELRSNFDSKNIGHEEFYKSFFETCYSRNEKLAAYLELFETRALAQAKELDKQPGDQPLAGLPIAIKDMISIKGELTTASSKMLEGFRAPRSATVVEKLEKQAAIFPGRTSCDEFAMGSSNENTPFGPVRNPLNLDCSPGGSSGGSAAAVAAEICVGALGTDTGGSIRLPASFCGIVGLRPTYGRVSRSGVIAFASSLDQVGPMADDALDTAYILEAIAGRDPRDATSMNIPVGHYVQAAQSPLLKGKKIGLPKEYFEAEGLSEDVKRLLQESIEVMKSEGAEFVDISLPHSKYGIAVYYLVATAEAASNLARYDGVRYGHRAENQKSVRDLIRMSRSEGFGPEVKRRIMLGSFSLSAGYYDAYYAKAQFVRSKIQNEFLEAFDQCDLIFGPCSNGAAFKIGEKAHDPLSMYLTDVFTVPINLAGVPAISFPIGNDRDGLPLGAQLIAAPFKEEELLSSLAAFERARPFKKGALQC